MWIKINYKQEEFEYEIFKPNAISVSLESSLTVPIKESDKSVRLSRVFPLLADTPIPNFDSGKIYFFDFTNPFRILGILKMSSSDKLQQELYFSNGLCSIILISADSKSYEELNSLINEEPNSYEIWSVKNKFIQKVDFKTPKAQKIDVPAISEYEMLSQVERVTLDEFAVSIKILSSKIEIHDIYNQATLSSLVTEVNEFIAELKYLSKPVGEIPDSIIERDLKFIESPLENQIMKQQILDRLIQINSTISYVSTQSYSGAVPILERRSLLRRNSLLGIGATIRSLNRLVKYIEDATSLIDFEGIITKLMPKATDLKGTERLPTYDCSKWAIQNIESFERINNRNDGHKLAYFSSRLGFRETEYSITAAVNSITSGLSLEWSLMTITHEMLHSHVRLILNSVFYGSEENTAETNFDAFYHRYLSKMLDENVPEYSLIDSIRNIILSYCCNSSHCGSLTNEMRYESSYTDDGIRVDVPPQTDFWNLFRNEYRNLNEIFVHVLDLHYFYGGRTTKYIPLIWCSWSAVPHINADIRQYILRSLLAIASKYDNNPYERWLLSVEKFKEIVENNFPENTDFPIAAKLKEVLNDDDLLKNSYFLAFKNSLIIVDLVMKVFYSQTIRAKLLEDEYISFERDDEHDEEELVYKMSNDFYDLKIDCPIPYLFNSMIKILNNKYGIEDLERATSFHFLAMNSKT